MNVLPPVGWADVATKHDLALVRDDVRNLRGELDDLRGEFNVMRGEFGALRADFNTLRGEFKELRSDLDTRLERGFRQILTTVSALVIAGFLVAIFAVVAAALVR